MEIKVNPHKVNNPHKATEQRGQRLKGVTGTASEFGRNNLSEMAVFFAVFFVGLLQERLLNKVRLIQQHRRLLPT